MTPAKDVLSELKADALFGAFGNDFLAPFRVGMFLCVGGGFTGVDNGL